MFGLDVAEALRGDARKMGLYGIIQSEGSKTRTVNKGDLVKEVAKVVSTKKEA